jgi:hypothetical protein
MTPHVDTKLKQLHYDAYVSRIGQLAARRYLATREEPPTRGNIRATIAFILLAAAVIFIGMVL